MTSRSDTATVIVLAVLTLLGLLFAASQARGQTDQAFSWCPVPEATEYELVWSETARTSDGQTPVGGSWNFTRTLRMPAPAEAGTVPAIQLTNHRRYFFSIRAKDATAWSGLSNEVCVRVGDKAPACPAFLPVPDGCEGGTGPRLPTPTIRIRPV